MRGGKFFMIYIPNFKPYYKDNNSAIFFADTFVALEKMIPECIDVIFADPPYFLSNDGFSVQSG